MLILMVERKKNPGAAFYVRSLGQYMDMIALVIFVDEK